MTREIIVKELREILKVYHYESKEQHISKDVVTSLENLLGGLLKDKPKEEPIQLAFPFPEQSQLNS